MPGSAEIVIARDERGATWLLRPGRDGENEKLTATDADRIIAEAGFERFNRHFSSWRELDEFRHAVVAERTPEFEIDLDKYAVEQLRELLDVARGWAVEGHGRDAHGLALDLLGARATGESPEFRREVREFIDDLEQPALPLDSPATRGAPTPLLQLARERYEQVRDKIAA